MALKTRCAAPAAASRPAPTPPRDTHLELREKGGVAYVRAVTHDGKKYRLFDITANGIVLRRSNNHRDLGIAIDSLGKIKVAN